MELRKFMVNSTVATTLRSAKSGGEASVSAKSLREAGLTVESMAQRLVAMYMELNEYYKGIGYSWYSDANLFAQLVGEMYGLSVWDVSQIISALSPQNPWDGKRDKNGNLYKEGNRLCTLRVIDAWFSGGADAVKALKGWGYAGAFTDKCIRILSGLEIDWSNAPKTHRFALLIANPSLLDIAVIDSHASRIATGNLGGVYHVVTKSAYAVIEKAYMLAAKVLGIPAYVLQAALWQVAADGLLY